MKPNYIKKWTVSAARLYLQVIALIDFIVFLSMYKENFDLKYNRVYFSQPIIHNYVPTSPIPKKDAATEIERLHGLMGKGMITQAEFEGAKRKLL
ncbi:SHOCT domain-containing protein [Sphingobacterium prati]|uniref:SHOCT domain-containing protein n=1 Tax=Sphingobacterium prati TaxID=2737006 RepID=UPI0015559E6C|nr:SHOCT domain-containing protein [Sphingobacterium prati]NPE45450.1 SHOCT domain-containing protein [Sphingobacterium prati]